MRQLGFALAFLGIALALSGKEVPVRIAGGEMVNLQLTPEGALPMKGAFFEMEGAGLVFHFKPGAPEASVAFAFRLLKKVTLQRVMVEDVTDDQPATLIDDSAPLPKEGRWTGVTPARSIDSATFAALFKNRLELSSFNPLRLLAADPKKSAPFRKAKGAVRVYRVSVTAAGEPTSTIIQPSWMGDAQLEALAAAVSKAEHAAPAGK